MTSSDEDSSGDDRTTEPSADDMERRQRLHEANNRLAAVIMNLAFARAVLGGSSPEAPLTELERSDLTVALDHAEEAAQRLASIVRELG